MFGGSNPPGVPKRPSQALDRPNKERGEYRIEPPRPAPRGQCRALGNMGTVVGQKRRRPTWRGWQLRAKPRPANWEGARSLPGVSQSADLALDVHDHDAPPAEDDPQDEPQDDGHGDHPKDEPDDLPAGRVRPMSDIPIVHMLMIIGHYREPDWLVWTVALRCGIEPVIGLTLTTHRGDVTCPGCIEALGIHQAKLATLPTASHVSLF